MTCTNAHSLPPPPPPPQPPPLRAVTQTTQSDLGCTILLTVAECDRVDCHPVGYQQPDFCYHLEKCVTASVSVLPQSLNRDCTERLSKCLVLFPILPVKLGKALIAAVCCSVLAVGRCLCSNACNDALSIRFVPCQNAVGIYYCSKVLTGMTLPSDRAHTLVLSGVCLAVADFQDQSRYMLSGSFIGWNLGQQL